MNWLQKDWVRTKSAILGVCRGGSRFQILEELWAFGRLASSGINICHFHQEKSSCTKACYECLLSYRNQFDHPSRPPFTPLPGSTNSLAALLVVTQQGGPREAQYQQLLKQTDPNLGV